MAHQSRRSWWACIPCLGIASQQCTRVRRSSGPQTLLPISSPSRLLPPLLAMLLLSSCHLAHPDASANRDRLHADDSIVFFRRASHRRVSDVKRPGVEADFFPPNEKLIRRARPATAS